MAVDRAIVAARRGAVVHVVALGAAVVLADHAAIVHLAAGHVAAVPGALEETRVAIRARARFAGFAERVVAADRERKAEHGREGRESSDDAHGKDSITTSELSRKGWCRGPTDDRSEPPQPLARRRRRRTDASIRNARAKAPRSSGRVAARQPQPPSSSPGSLLFGSLSSPSSGTPGTQIPSRSEQT